MAYSFSGIKDYEGCPRRYYEVKVLKAYPRQETEATIWGGKVHEAAEFYIRDGKPFEFEFPGQDIVKAVAERPGTKFCELEMAVNDKLEPVEFSDPQALVRGIADVVIIQDDKARIGDWKGLALDTRLPTPTGFTTMGDVRVGDTLFSESGKPCQVVGKSEVKHLRCFKVTFNKTISVVCDEEHLWKLVGGGIVHSEQLRSLPRSADHPSGIGHVRVNAALVLPEAALPIDPYVLGLWLADGKHTSGEISKPDIFVWEEIQRRGYTVNMDTGGNKSCPTRTVQGLMPQLRALGLLGNKHVPVQYLRAGYQQRLDLLRGLMDGDGSVNTAREQAVFTNTDRQLSMAVHELLCSLGQRPLLSVTRQHGFGLTVTAFPVSFKPLGINPFYLPRKRNRVLDSWGSGHSWYHSVSSVEEVPSVPTQCIKVDSEDHTFLCTESMVPTHNTGSDKYPDTAQLELMALLLFAREPNVQKSHGALFFLKHNTIVQKITKREDSQKLWSEWLGRIERIERAHETGVWNAKPSGLCKRYCPVLGCEHNGQR